MTGFPVAPVTSERNPFFFSNILHEHTWAANLLVTFIPAHLLLAIGHASHPWQRESLSIWTSALCNCRNILPENLHFDKDLKVKLSHFSTAVELHTGAVATGAVSVLDYLAPEVWLFYIFPRKIYT